MSPQLGPKTPPGTAVAPSRITIAGRHASLVPVSESHTRVLFSHLGGPERNDLWTYLFTDSPPDLATFEPQVANWSTSTDPLYFAVIGKNPKTNEDEALGVLSYLNIEPEHRRIEIGSIVLGEAVKRTRIATEAFYRSIKHAFDDLGYLRVEWKCNDKNKPSMDAAARLGFTYEGTFRQHIITKGTRRDTAWYSIIQEEWPAVKQGFERWLDDANFDEQGRQKRRLQECREE